MNSLETLLALSAVVAISTRAIIALQPTDQEIAVRHPGIIQLHEFRSGNSQPTPAGFLVAAAKHRSSEQPSTVPPAVAATVQH